MAIRMFIKINGNPASGISICFKTKGKYSFSFMGKKYFSRKYNKRTDKNGEIYLDILPVIVFLKIYNGDKVFLQKYVFLKNGVNKFEF